MNFGPETTEPDSFVIMDKALETGINFWDTADVYGWKEGERITEKIIGNFFAQGGGRREKTVIGTKLFGGMGKWPNESRLSKLRIRNGVEGSLKALQTDYIDLIQMHHVDRDAPWDEIWEAFEQLQTQGKSCTVGRPTSPGGTSRRRTSRRRSAKPRSGFRAVEVPPAVPLPGTRSGSRLQGVRPRASSPGRRWLRESSAAR
jgi:aryl-alcohol dehydrogenase-like predicted oxidoreductase